MHDIGFEDNVFDTVVNTFGLECCYNIDKAFSEIKRVCKPGGKIIMIERSKGKWDFDNYRVM